MSWAKDVCWAKIQIKHQNSPRKLSYLSIWAMKQLYNWKCPSVHQFISLSPKPLSQSKSCLSAITCISAMMPFIAIMPISNMPISHQTYWPPFLLAIIHINYRANEHQPSCLSAIMPVSIHTHLPLCLSAIFPYSHHSYLPS